MSSLRICVVASTYPRHEADYAVPWLRETVARLLQRGHQVTVLAPAFKGMADHRIDGVPVRRFRYAPARFETLTHEEGAPYKVTKRWRQLLGVPYVACGRAAAAALAHEQHFDVVHVHWPFPHATIGSVIAGKCQAPLVLNCHGAELAMARKKWWIKAWLRHALKRGDLLLANSTDTAQRMHHLCGREAIVVPYGATVPEREEPMLSKIASSDRLPRILFTGRLIERKGLEYLLRAVPHILTHRRVEVVITGDGDQRTGLESLTQALGLSKVVRFLGFVSKEQLAQEYAACDVWVNPAIHDRRGDTEGLGVGSIEAYAYGKPVVASAVGGIPDTVVHERTGLLVPEKNEQALAEAILRVIHYPAWGARLGEQGREFAREQFCWDRITRHLENLYGDVLSNRHQETMRRTSKAAVVPAWHPVTGG